MNNAQTITLYQPLLHSIAYNLVRCKEDAEDIVQETFIKWLSITNNCLNHLNSLKKKKEEYIDNVTEAIHRFKENNLSHIDLEIDLSAAMHLLSAKLEPLERAVYVLKEAFDFDYDALQETLDKKKEHCRQLFCRAKKKLEEETSKVHFPHAASLVASFRNASAFGNAGDLINELKRDISTALGKNSK
jgi:DNA-directed RNA polymerase specialized sigma24 family protein